MVTKCVINTCNTAKAGDEVTLHKLPNNPKIKTEWLRVINNETGQTFNDEKDEIMICSKHFSIIDGEKVLNLNAIPFVDVNDVDEDEEPPSKRVKLKSSASSDDEDRFCHALFCGNSSFKTEKLHLPIIYHSFPTDTDIVKQWNEFCGGSDGGTDENLDNRFICSEHFTVSDYDIVTDDLGLNKKVLKPTAVPTVADKSVINEDEMYNENDDDENDEDENVIEGQIQNNRSSIRQIGFTKKTYISSSPSKISNATQYQILMSFIERNKIMTTKCSRRDTEQKAKNQVLWDKLANKLNAEGPPVRPCEAWKKIWTDFKYNVKCKLIRNRNILAGKETGKILPYTSLEQRVIKLFSMDVMLNGISDSKTIGTNNKASSSTAIKNNKFKFATISKENKNQRTECEGREEISPTAELLKKQMKLQESYFKKLIEGIGELKDVLGKHNEIMERGLQLKQREFEEKQTYRQERLRLERASIKNEK